MMDLSKLEKSEQIAARVFIRKRRKALEALEFMQSLSKGDIVKDNRGNLLEILEIRDINSEYALGDITLIVQNINSNTLLGRRLYPFKLQYAEVGFLEVYIEKLRTRRDIELRDFLCNIFTDKLEKCAVSNILFKKEP